MKKINLKVFALILALFGLSKEISANVFVESKAIHSDGTTVRTYGWDFDDQTTWSDFKEKICIDNNLRMVGRMQIGQEIIWHPYSMETWRNIFDFYGTVLTALPDVTLKGRIEPDGRMTLKKAYDVYGANGKLEVEIFGRVIDSLFKKEERKE